MSQLEPTDFIITRKRKRYKFALFSNSPLCFEADEWSVETIDVLEIAAGNGLFSVELASRYPEKQFVAVDVKADRLQKGAAEAEKQSLTNIRFLRARVDQLSELIEPHSIQSLWITFPDPFPRESSAKHRLTYPKYLALYEKLLKPDGQLFLKTDSPDLFHWSLEQLVQDNWQLQALSFDLHGSILHDDFKIMTTFEKRWTNEGIVTNFVKAGKVKS